MKSRVFRPFVSDRVLGGGDMSYANLVGIGAPRYIVRVRISRTLPRARGWYRDSDRGSLPESADALLPQPERRGAVPVVVTDLLQGDAAVKIVVLSDVEGARLRGRAPGAAPFLGGRHQPLPCAGLA